LPTDFPAIDEARSKWAPEGDYDVPAPHRSDELAVARSLGYEAGFVSIIDRRRTSSALKIRIYISKRLWKRYAL
jgi:hypothetical protein